MKLGIYGGTFNPPHLGHTGAAQAAVAALQLDKLLFMPDHLPPHKEVTGDSPTPRQRMDMLNIAVDGLQAGDKIEVSGLEIERGGTSYTADTVRIRYSPPSQQPLWL